MKIPNIRSPFNKFICFYAIVFLPISINAQERNSVDELNFGKPDSEEAHKLTADKSEVISGGLEQWARILLPEDPISWKGGSLAFKMKVDPEQQNYFTIKLWGSDRDETMLLLFSEGKQVGYRHLGDIDLLHKGNGEPPFNNRFYYVTIPVPLQHTKGKEEANLEIRSYGKTWDYGDTFERYQKEMEVPSLGLYKAYTHTKNQFEPSKNEVQGEALDVSDASVRSQPGEEVLDQVKERVNNELRKILASENAPHQQEIMFLAPAYSVEWTAAYKNQKVIKKIIDGIDAHYRKIQENPDLISSDKNIYNGDWLTVGPIARAIRDLYDEISPVLEENIHTHQGEQITRREALSEMFQSSLEYSTTHRRQYTNQSMIMDLFMYDVNRALMLIDPDNALPEFQTLRYLYESVGLAPWLGKETDDGPAKNLGDNYWQLTEKGLTKELGYVGYYGEVLDWVVDIYKSSALPGMPETGDPIIKQQLLKMMNARSYFRYPALDENGNKAMRIEAVIGWRDQGHYPGNVLYGDRGIAWDATPLMTAAATLDPKAVGIAKQMLADNQFFKMLQDKMEINDGLRITKSLLHVPEEYELIKSLPESDYRLPMSDGMPDFVFADEENGVIALKNGEEILYVSLYWRARNALNNLAKVHFITPKIDRIANIYIESEFEDSGMIYERPNWVNLGFADWREFYPEDIKSAHTGEKLPIAKIPDGLPFEPGDENVYAGKANFYKMEYGNYLVLMNTTEDKDFEVQIPEKYSKGSNLITGRKVDDIKVILKPRKTVVIHKENNL